LAIEQTDGVVPLYNHLYMGSRCVYCNINDLDASLYGPEQCSVQERVEVWSFGPDENTVLEIMDPEHDWRLADIDAILAGHDNTN